jgi:vacuolar protein sorting-associated protein VTA1
MAAANRLLGLPPIPPELKSIAPYLQRADELKSQDPIMAYWCAYYAAQVGISLKAKGIPSRDLLFNLLGVLERLKKEIGPNDAIDMEAASSAYVENFALRVFATADNEDRSSNASRFVPSVP